VNEWEWQLLEDKTIVDHLVILGVEVRMGDRVRLFPHKGGDILDIALHGQTATIESIEQDYEGKSHICVVLDDDPGRDMGLLRQPGHRFFFDPSEVKPLPREEQPKKDVMQKPRILVAGIGNIFLGDDGFGVEVAQQLARCDFPPSVRVADFGIRGFDLAYALQDGYETTILIDAFPHGQAQGTVSVVEPDLNDPASSLPQANFDTISCHVFKSCCGDALSKVGEDDGLLKEASNLAIVLRAGALPANLELQEQRLVGPSLGQDSIRFGIISGIVGCSLIFIFMILFFIFFLLFFLYKYYYFK